MNPDLQLCPHLAAASSAGFALARDDVIDWQDGPAVAALRCPHCEGCGLLELLDQDGALQVRVYALRALLPRDLAIYRRNLERGSCDASRAQAETQALFAAAGPAERVVAYDVHANALLASGDFPTDAPVPTRPWRERLPEPGDTRWFRAVGLAKAAPHSPHGPHGDSQRGERGGG